MADGRMQHDNSGGGARESQPGPQPTPLEDIVKRLQDIGAFEPMGMIINASLDLTQRLRNLLLMVMRLLGAERGSIMLLDDRREALEVMVSHGLSEEARRSRVRLGEGIAGWVAEHREPLILHDVVREPRFRGSDPMVRSALAIPLMAEDRLVGVLNVSTLQERRFTPEDLLYLSAFAELGALMVENAVLYDRLRLRQQELEKELSLASRIQQSIIAKHVPCAAVKLMARLMPASAVGGDFYSVIPLARDSRFCFYCSPRVQDRCQKLRSEFCPNKFGVVIGDVANKGLPAALIMAVLTTSLYELGKNHISPKTILSEANQTFRRCFHESQYNFATLFYGFFDGHSRSFTYSKAGHDTPLLVRAGDGSIEPLEAEGYPLGLREDGEFEERTVILEKGDRIILFTDGLTGALNAAGEIFGRQRFLRFVRSHQGQDLDTLVDHLVDEIMLFTGDAPQPDDIAVMVMELEEEYDLTMTIGTDVREIRSVISNVLEALGDLGSGESMALRLCLEEVIHNAMEHGNEHDASKKIYITLKKENGRAYIKVRDEGPGFDHAEVMRRNMDDRRDLLSVRGRGLWIVRHYAEGLRFNREGNEVTLIMRL